MLFGVPGAIRTRGLSLRRRTLYPAELRKQTVAIIILTETGKNVNEYLRLILKLPLTRELLSVSETEGGIK